MCTFWSVSVSYFLGAILMIFHLSLQNRALNIRGYCEYSAASSSKICDIYVCALFLINS